MFDIEEIKKLKLEIGDVLFIKTKPGFEEKLVNAIKMLEEGGFLKTGTFLVHSGEIEDFKVVNQNNFKNGEDMND